MELFRLGICGIISFLSYTAMVIFSPLAYPGYDWMTMAISDLGAEGAPSQTLAAQLNSLFGPCAIVSIMAVCVAIRRRRTKTFKWGIYLFAAMEWVCNVGYTMFPWIKDAENSNPQNVLHIAVTVSVVILSIAGIILIIIGAKKENLGSLGIWAAVCLAAMVAGAMGTSFLPKAVFGICERLSTFSTVVFNMILGIYLLKGKFEEKW